MQIYVILQNIYICFIKQARLYCVVGRFWPSSCMFDTPSLLFMGDLGVSVVLLYPNTKYKYYNSLFLLSYT